MPVEIPAPRAAKAKPSLDARRIVETMVENKRKSMLLEAEVEVEPIFGELRSSILSRTASGQQRPERLSDAAIDELLNQNPFPPPLPPPLPLPDPADVPIATVRILSVPAQRYADAVQLIERCSQVELGPNGALAILRRLPTTLMIRKSRLKEFLDGMQENGARVVLHAGEGQGSAPPPELQTLLEEIKRNIREAEEHPKTGEEEE